MIRIKLGAECWLLDYGGTQARLCDPFFIFLLGFCLAPPWNPPGLIKAVKSLSLNVALISMTMTQRGGSGRFYIVTSKPQWHEYGCVNTPLRGHAVRNSLPPESKQWGIGNSFQPAIDATQWDFHRLRHCPKRKGTQSDWEKVYHQITPDCGWL